MPTIQFNNNPKDNIQLDPGSENWLNNCKRNSGNQRACAMPKKYFDILLAWGYVQGTPGNARISPAGLARLLSEANSQKATSKKH